MRELIPVLEEALGPNRLRALKRDPDDFQQFWVGVLEALARVDWDRDAVAYLVTAGYGSVRNARRASWTHDRYRHCLKCGKLMSYRRKICECGSETDSAVRGSEYQDIEPSREGPDVELALTIEAFVDTLSGATRYIAKRWLIDRADLKYQNHTKQIAYELGISAPRVAQIKKVLKQELAAYILTLEP